MPDVFDLEETQFKYLKDQKDSSILNKDSRSQEAIKLILLYAYQEYSLNKTIYLCRKYDFGSVLVRFLSKEQQKLFKLLETNRITRLDDNQFMLSNICIAIMSVFANACDNFCYQMMKLGAVDLLLKFIQHEDMLQSYIELNSTEKCPILIQIENIVRGSIGCLINLSKVYPYTRANWRLTEPNIEMTLWSLSRRIKSIKDSEFALSILIASVIDEAEIQNSMLVSPIITRISDAIGDLCVPLALDQQAIKRTFIKISQQKVKLEQVRAVRVANSIWHLVELLNPLYNLALNDLIKYEIYIKSRASLRAVILRGNDIEVKHALRLLWQLCFDIQVVVEVKKDIDLMKKLIEIKNGSAVSLKSLRKQARKLLWQLKNLHLIISPMMYPSKLKNRQQVVLSHGKRAREICWRIKKEIESAGHSVWMNIRSSYSHIDVIARVIEKSSVVFICVSEEYKQNPFCRIQAEYAMQSRKKIVLLVMESCFTLDGWLGFIYKNYASSSLIDFATGEFQDCIEQLKLYLNDTSPVESEEESQINKPVCEWSSRHVTRWLVERNIASGIVEKIVPCNGELLYELYSVLCSAPGLFYSCMASPSPRTTDSVVSVVVLRDIVQFTHELKSLFQVRRDSE